MENKVITVTGPEADAVLEAKKSLESKVPLENAVADMKRQLSKESKNTLIRQWIGLYAQVVNLSTENERLRIELRKCNNSNTGASASEGESK